MKPGERWSWQFVTHEIRPRKEFMFRSHQWQAAQQQSITYLKEQRNRYVSTVMPCTDGDHGVKTVVTIGGSG
jgi:hypothetical protein